MLTGLLGLFLFATSSSADDWVRMRPNSESFIISVPKVFRRHEEVGQQPWGRHKTVIYSVEHGFGSYAVIYADYPPAFIEKVDRNRLIDAQQANLVPRARSEVLSAEPIEIGGFVGREVAFEFDGGRRLSVARIGVVGNRLYTVMATTTRKGLPRDDILRFLDSFELR
ncbi:hypothetical protein MK489_02390 [Myxococcota bacterium]|nr:hypothetical protein [Myxococcota bacterium]